MKKILLTKGQYALVDDQDFEWLNQHKWYCSHGYAVRYAGGGRKNRVIKRMHRVVNKTPEGKITDHINRNKLDNRRNNLRSANKSENGLNAKLRVDNTTGHKGIYRDKSRDKWVAELFRNGKNLLKKRFDTKEEAIAKRKEMESQYVHSS